MGVVHAMRVGKLAERRTLFRLDRARRYRWPGLLRLPFRLGKKRGIGYPWLRNLMDDR